MRTPPRSACLLHLLLAPLATAGCFADPPTIELPQLESSGGTDDAPVESSGASSSSGSPSDSGETTTDAGTTDVADDSSSGTPVDSSTGEPPSPRLVFVTEGAFFANLGGVAGADARCAAEADAAGRSGEFLAWISDDAVSPAARFVREGGPWVLANDTLVAAGWDDLADGVLDHAIELDAAGLPIDDPLAVWTNTDWNGEALGADCQGWTSMAFADGGIFGDFRDDAFGQWTAWGDPTPFPCENTFHLYCFEQ